MSGKKLQIGIWSVIAILFFSNINLLPLFVFTPKILTNQNIIKNNQLIQQINKYSVLKNFVNSETKVGFISNTKPDEVFNDNQSVKNFHALQFAIAPVMLENSVNNKYVVGVFDDKVLVLDSLEPYKYFENGFIIFRNKNYDQCSK